MNKVKEIIDFINRENYSKEQTVEFLNTINILSSEDKAVILLNVIKRDELSKEDTINFLKSINSIEPVDKNLIVLYLFPRVLLDRELPIRVINYRESAGKSAYGSLIPDKSEAVLFIEAYRTPQYKRFMQHLFYSFGNKTPDQNEELKIYPIDYNVDECECPLCGKKIVGINELDKLKKSITNTNEFTAYTTNTTGLCLCLDCIVNLYKAGEILTRIESN